MRICGIIWAIVLLAVLGDAWSFGAIDTSQIIYKTPAEGPPDTSGGVVLTPLQYIGVRFQTTQDYFASAIGGIIGGIGPNQVIFGALIRLDSINDFPDSVTPLETSDVLSVALLMPPGFATEITVPIDPVFIPAGYYAIMFGSGQFGATGDAFAGHMLRLDDNSAFFYNQNAGPQYQNTSGGLQFEVLGYVPEPASFISCCLLTVSSLMRRRR